MHEYLRARTAFFDRVVVNALDRGITQVVTGGAGYDGRAFRYAQPGCPLVRGRPPRHPGRQAGPPGPARARRGAHRVHPRRLHRRPGGRPAARRRASTRPARRCSSSKASPSTWTGRSPSGSRRVPRGHAAASPSPSACPPAARCSAARPAHRARRPAHGAHRRGGGCSSPAGWRYGRRATSRGRCRRPRRRLRAPRRYRPVRPRHARSPAGTAACLDGPDLAGNTVRRGVGMTRRWVQQYRGGA